MSLFDTLTSDAVKPASSGSSGGGGSSNDSGTSANSGDTFPVVVTPVGFKDSANNLASARVFDMNTGAGVETVLGVSLRTSSGSGSLEHGSAAAPFRVDPTGTTTQPISITNSSLPVSQLGNWDITTVSTVTSITNVVHIDDNGGSITVDGAVSASQSGTWNIGTVSTITNVVHIDDNNSSLTIDGSVTANQGGTWNITDISGTISLPTGAATESTLGNVLTTSAFQARINTQGQKAMSASTPVVVASDQSGLPVTQSGQWSVDANITNTVLHVDDNSGSLTVDGNINAAQSGDWSVEITDGSHNATIRTLAGGNALNVAIVDANGDQITSFSGGGGGPSSTVAATQSGQWTVDANITNTVIHVDDNSSTLSVDDGGGSLTVDGSVAITNSVIHIDDNSSTLSIDDGNGSITVDGALAATQSGVWNITDISGTVSLPTGASTESTLGLVKAKTDNLDVALSTRLKPADTLAGVTTVGSITSVVHVDDNNSTISIDDGSSSITVDNNGTFATQATLQTGSNQIGHLEANQSVNLTMVSGLNVDLGTGTAGSGTLRVAVASDSFSASQAVTGTVTVQQGTGTNLHTVIDSGSVTVSQGTGSNLHTVLDSGTLTGITNVVHIDDNASTVSIDDGAGSITVDGTVAVTQSGIWTIDSITNALPAGSNVIGHVIVDTAPTTAVTNAGLSNLDVALSTRLKPADTLAGVTTLGSITNVVHVDDNSGSLTVDNNGTFAVQATLQAGTNQIGHLEANQSVNLTMVSGLNVDLGNGTAGTGTLRVAVASDSFPATQAVSGTVTVQQGTGTNLHTVVDSGAVTVSQGTGTNLHAVIDSGSITVTQGTGSNLHAVLDSGTLTTITNVVHVDDNASSLTVDGTVTASLQAGAKGATVAAAVTSTAEGSDHQSLDVQIYHGGAAIDPTQIRALTSSDTVTAAQATASSLNAQVVGNIASAATDSGNPVKIGGKYNTTPPTFTNGQRGDLQLSSRGDVLVVFKNADTISGFTINSNTRTALLSASNQMQGTLTIFLSSLGTGGNLQLQTSDGSNFYTIPVLNVNTGVVSSTMTTAGVYQGNIAGFTNTWVLSTGLSAGSITGNWTVGPAASLISIGNPLPTGTNTIGAATVARATSAAPAYSDSTNVNLSTDLSGALRVSGSFSASTAATATASDPSYTEGSSSNLSQTLAGLLRTLSYAKVSDSPESYLDGDNKPLSLNSEGRLRVAVAPATTYMDFFGTDFASVDSDDFGNMFDISNSPWDGLNNKK